MTFALSRLVMSSTEDSMVARLMAKPSRLESFPLVGVLKTMSICPVRIISSMLGVPSLIFFTVLTLIPIL